MTPNSLRYRIKIFGGEEPIDPASDNVDVEVILSNGDRYVATFFTIENIRRIMERYVETGECANGKYFWASDMIIVDELTEEAIEETVRDLMISGEFFKAFSGPLKD
jgi:hypothetical protein